LVQQHSGSLPTREHFTKILCNLASILPFVNHKFTFFNDQFVLRNNEQFVTTSVLDRRKTFITKITTHNVNHGVSISIGDVRENIAQRDLQDTTRAADPLRKATDAIVLDNSNLTEEEQFSFLMVQARKAIELKTLA
jgi:hypothetical protein